MIDLKNEITLYSKPSCLFGRPYSRCPPSLQALKGLMGLNRRYVVCQGGKQV